MDLESQGVTSSIWSQTLGSGTGANFIVSAPKVILQDGGRILTDTYTLAAGGNITINAQQVNLESIARTNYNSSIFGVTYQSGKGGNLNISTENLLLREGGQIIVSTYPLLTANLSKNPDAIQPVWKLGNKVQEATQLIKTSDGRLMLVSLNTNLTSAQNLTCN